MLVQKVKRNYSNIPIELIKSPENPSREVFEDIGILAETIKRHGLLQPLLVKRSEGTYGFEVIVGERRLRACKKAELTQIPCIVLDGIDEEKILEMQLIENLQRSDLRVFEEIRLVETLKNHYDLTNEEIAVKIGLSASTVSSYLTIAEGLSEDYIKMIEKGKGRNHSNQSFTIGKALLLAQNQLPEDKLKENVELIKKKGISTAQLSKKLAKSQKTKIKRVVAGRKFWSELTRTLRDFSNYWSDFCELEERESVDAFHLTLSVTMPKDLNDPELKE
jgi:ParB family chromosome partitioning protein